MRIDLNADLGESFGSYQIGNDEAMLELVTSANVACGFHGGDPAVMARTVETCLEHGVSIGAHPGFADLQGFGRRRIHGIPDEELTALVQYQVGALGAIATAAGAHVAHVKLHGALANMASEDDELAKVCLSAISAFDSKLAVFAMVSTALDRVGHHLGMPVVREVFADRSYNADGTLVSRDHPDAMIHDAEFAADRVLEMIIERRVTALDGTSLVVEPQSVCVHGDHSASVEMAATIRTRLEEAGVELASPQY